MKTPEPHNIFGNFDAFKQRQATNRQSAYENKVCKKIIVRKFKDDASAYSSWMATLKETDEPLAAVQDLFRPMYLYTNRLQSWDIHSLFKDAKLQSHPIWQEFSVIIDDCAKAYPDRIPAMIFYNSVIGQDMVIHTNLTSRCPCGYFRLIRESKSGAGGIVLDTLDGWLEVF